MITMISNFCIILSTSKFVVEPIFYQKYNRIFITVTKVRPNSVWSVSPSSGEIPAEGRLELSITACLNDCVRFQDKVQINFLEGPSRTVPLTAYGHGTTIVADPPMSPTLNLGPHFRYT